VTVEPDHIWVNDRDVWTSAGVAAGIDLSLAMIASDVGEAMSRQAAQESTIAGSAANHSFRPCSASMRSPAGSHR